MAMSKKIKPMVVKKIKPDPVPKSGLKTRKLKGGAQVNDSMKAMQAWKSIDPIYPIVDLDWKRPDNKNVARNFYGKGRKSNPKKSGDWFSPNK